MQLQLAILTDWPLGWLISSEADLIKTRCYEGCSARGTAFFFLVEKV